MTRRYLIGSAGTALLGLAVILLGYAQMGGERALYWAAVATGAFGAVLAAVGLVGMAVAYADIQRARTYARRITTRRTP